MVRAKGSPVVISSLLLIGLQCCFANVDMWVTEKAYMDISIGGVPVGRIEFGLFFNIVPRTVYNFRALILGKTTTIGQNGEEVLLSYKHSIFHRTIKNFMIQGGDILYGNGYGFISLWGMHFPDENFDILHCGPGFIGMANRGPNTNGCQIYITTALTSWLDRKHVIFGKVLSGMDVVRKIENNPTDNKDRPILEVRIEDSGTLPLDQPFLVLCTPVEG